MPAGMCWAPSPRDFDSGALTDRLARWLCGQEGKTWPAAPELYRDYQARQYDLLAEGLRNAMDMEQIYRILKEGGGGK